MKHLEKKAMGVLERVCSMGERKLGESGSGSMRLFNALIASVITYGAEIWAWKERKGLEEIQDRYLKCYLKLVRTT